ncbi:MAG: DUF1622 domain-containing protein [Sulfuricella denitrificans]|nr:DUF1622 domain-containing protein [Sulfuricella denitrificans]
MHEFLVRWVTEIAPWIEAIGVVVVLWGALEGLLMLINRLRLSFGNREGRPSLGQVRLAIGEKIALGLDFFLAGDIILTIVVPSWEGLAILGSIVVIRTVIAYFLNRDLKELRE